MNCDVRWRSILVNCFNLHSSVIAEFGFSSQAFFKLIVISSINPVNKALFRYSGFGCSTKWARDILCLPYGLRRNKRAIIYLYRAIASSKMSQP